MSRGTDIGRDDIKDTGKTDEGWSHCPDTNIHSDPMDAQVMCV